MQNAINITKPFQIGWTALCKEDYAKPMHRSMTNRINDFISRGAYAPALQASLINTVSGAMRTMLNDRQSAISYCCAMCVLFFSVSLRPV